MKQKILSLIIACLIMAPSKAQTAIYKAFSQRTNIEASCIEGLPITDGMKVTVTMLEADDDIAFRHMMNALKALPTTDKKKKNTGLDAFARNLDSLGCSKSTTITESMLSYLFSNIESANINITPVTDKDGKAYDHPKTTNMQFMARTPLPGDNGVYLIYHSDSTRTVLVFHCPNNEVYAQTILYVLKKRDELKFTLPKF
ncbi:MAG: hypothetical protein J6X79_05175 [Bacteroidales bacterium]|nr:hypothetical protein [Bacteroidales bacterium]